MSTEWSRFFPIFPYWARFQHSNAPCSATRWPDDENNEVKNYWKGQSFFFPAEFSGKSKFIKLNNRPAAGRPVLHAISDTHHKWIHPIIIILNRTPRLSNPQSITPTRQTRGDGPANVHTTFYLSDWGYWWCQQLPARSHFKKSPTKF